MTKTAAYQALFAIMTLTILSVVGMAMPYPVLTPLLLDATPSGLNSFAGLPPKLLLASLLAGYPLGMLLGSSFIGSVSDVYGRKPTLMITTLGSAASYGLSAWFIYADSFLGLLIARFVTGLFEGNIAVARAMTADLHPVIDKTRAMSYVYGVTYGGWLLGPLAGGYLMIFGGDMAFLIAAGITLLSALVIQFFVRSNNSNEDAANENATNSTVRTDSSPAISANSSYSSTTSGTTNIRRLVRHAVNNNSYTLLKKRSMRQMFMWYLVIMSGLNAFYEFLPVWLFEQLHKDSVGIGHGTALVTLSMITTSLVFIERLKKVFNIKILIQTGLVAFGIIQCCAPLITESTLVAYALISGASIALFNVLFPVFLSDKYHHYEQGMLFGLLTSTFCLSNVLIAVLGGLISLLSASAALILGGVLVLVGATWFYLLYRESPAST